MREKLCKHCETPIADDLPCSCDGAEVERLTPAQALIDLLQAENASVTLDCNGSRLFWSDASEAWETITWKRGNAVTHYNGPDLAAAIIAFKKVAGIE